MRIKVSVDGIVVGKIETGADAIDRSIQRYGHLIPKDRRIYATYETLGKSVNIATQPIVGPTGNDTPLQYPAGANGGTEGC